MFVEYRLWNAAGSGGRLVTAWPGPLRLRLRAVVGGLLAASSDSESESEYCTRASGMVGLVWVGLQGLAMRSGDDVGGRGSLSGALDGPGTLVPRTRQTRC